MYFFLIVIGRTMFGCNAVIVELYIIVFTCVQIKGIFHERLNALLCSVHVTRGRRYTYGCVHGL